MRSGYRGGVRAAAPLAVAVFGFGVSYGVLARGAGMGVLAPIVMSATTFAGSSQFAAASVLEHGGAAAAAAVAAILLNARYAPIGLSVAPYLEGGRLRRFLEAQMIVDESWVVSGRGDGTYDREVLIGAGMLLYAAWVTSTAVGVVAGDLLGDPERLGLDAAFPALFLALLIPQLRSRKAVTAALLGGLIALALIPVAPPGVPIIAASAACLVGLYRPEPRSGAGPEPPPTPEAEDGLP